MTTSAATGGVTGRLMRTTIGLSETAGVLQERSEELRRVVTEARSLKRLLDAFPTHYPRHILEQAALAGAFDPGRADDLAAAAAVLASHPLPVCAILYRALTGGAGQSLTIAADGAHASCHATSAAHVGPSALDLLLANPPGFEVTLDAVDEHFDRKEAMTGPQVMRHFEKALMLNVLDQQWKDHLASMDYLRQGIGLRGYAQKQPMQEYKRESYDMFTALLDNIKHEVIRILARVQVKAEEDVEAVEARRRQSPTTSFSVHLG